MEENGIKKNVRAGYADVAQGRSSCCCGPSASCCGGGTAEMLSKNLGYSDQDLSAVPNGANLGLGCGNPLAFAGLRPGETVLDLGSGAGFDCFLVAKGVGPQGRVIGVDMTPEMIAKAVENAKRSEYQNVQFRLGEIERLPIEDNSIDVVISNCVINLSPNKAQVFREIHRVLKPGGRMLLSDIVLLAELPPAIRDSDPAYVGCIAGAILKDEYLRLLREAGFEDAAVKEATTSGIEHIQNMAGDGKDVIQSVKIGATKTARKP